MNNLYESEYYDISYRAIFTKDEVVKLVTDNDFIESCKEFSFDIDYNSNTSLNYFLSAIISGIMQNLAYRINKSTFTFEDMEGKIKVKLKNPLTMLNVRGYDESPYIKDCDITIYISSFEDCIELEKFCRDSLKYSFIYNTLKSSVNFNVKFLISI